MSVNVKTSPECRSGNHEFCDVRWKNDGIEYLCGCKEGACHKNWAFVTPEGEFDGQTTIDLGE